MPTYTDPDHGLRRSEGLLEAAHTAPLVPLLSTFELWHPSLAAPIYVVSNPEPIDATKEADAERDPGATVTFLASSLQVTRPEESDTGASPGVTVSVSNVSGFMWSALKAARGSLVPWQLIERVYRADDLSGPAQLPPLVVELGGVGVNGLALTISAGYGDASNVAIPRATFRRTQYPGLVR